MLQGPRVKLRAIEKTDLRRQWAFNNNLDIELAGGGDPPIPQSYERLEAEYERAAQAGGRNGASFAIETDGIFIGQCALFNEDTTARTSEIGITIGDPDYLGRGYGREAIELLTDYAFRFRNLSRVWLRVHFSNERALRAYRACGFIEEGRLRRHVWSNGSYDDLVIMGQLASDRPEH